MPAHDLVPRLTELVRRAEQGDASAIVEAQTLLDQSPGLWGQVGDLARHAEAALIGQAAGGNPLIQQAVARHLARSARELAGPSPSPLESLLARNVAFAQAFAAWADLLVLRREGVPLAQAEACQRVQARASRRLAEAAWTLAVVRKLLSRPAARPAGDQREAPPAKQRRLRTRHETACTLR